jgi:hypothetical protein
MKAKGAQPSALFVYPLNVSDENEAITAQAG